MYIVFGSGRPPSSARRALLLSDGDENEMSRDDDTEKNTTSAVATAATAAIDRVDIMAPLALAADEDEPVILTIEIVDCRLRLEKCTYPHRPTAATSVMVMTAP